MSINNHTTLIVKLLKKTQVDDDKTIWDVFGQDKEFRNYNFNKQHLELFDTVYLDSIKKMKQTDIIALWSGTEDAYLHSISRPFQEPPPYEGDMIADIRDEIMPLISLDLDFFYEK